MEASRELIPINQSDVPDYSEVLLSGPDIQSPLYRNSCDLAAELIANGNSYRGVAAKLGLAESTVNWWIRYSVHFNALIEQKKVERREKLLSRIEDFGEKTWFANAWILERNKAFKGEFAQPKAGSGGQTAIQINVVLSSSPGQGDTTITLSPEPDCDQDNKV